jgi:hypothetical protein
MKASPIAVTLLALFACGVLSSSSAAQSVGLQEGFSQPPPAARPWVYWMWLRVDTTPEAVTRDLEEMRAKGIEGAVLYDSGFGGGVNMSSKMVLRDKGYFPVKTDEYAGGHIDKIPRADLGSWTPRSRELIRHAAKEAGRLGIRLCLTVGLASTSGPIAAEYGQQKLVWSKIAVTGPRRFDQPLPEPGTKAPAVPGQAQVAKTRKAKAASSNARQPIGSDTKSGNVRQIAVLAVPNKETISPDDVVILSDKADAAGRLRWNVPAGTWSIFRFAYSPTGKTNAWGLYTDGMSAEALDKTWDATIGLMLQEMTPDERKGLYAVEDDSWEAGETTWTGLFPTEFQKLRGYNLIPWLPVLAGETMGAAGDANAVKRDYCRTIADLVATNHYAHLRQLAGRNGLVCFSEPAGPNTRQLDLMKDCKGVDVAMGEFWVPSPHRPTPARRFLLRNAASANHIYGKPFTPCEGFTSIGPFWEESFFDLKNTADQAFCDGCNLVVIHNFSQSPSVTAMPGYVYFAGTEYNRNVTWWNQTPAFHSYLGRCSFLLQQGLFVADALYYRGDGIGLGESMKTDPALPAPGYDHDNCNLDALLTRVGVKNGRLVLPDGMSYRILVLPDDSPVAPEALNKIAELVEGGATVVGPRPSREAGLVTAEKKAKFDALAARLWTGDSRDNHLGAGRVIAGETPAQVLRKMNIPPDFEYTGLSARGELDWIHRRAGETDIYYLASRWDPKEQVACFFRVCGKQPELWNPVTGEIRSSAAFRQEAGRTIVPLEFDPRGSVFVVFRKPISPYAQGAASSNYPVIVPRSELTGPWAVSFDPKWGGPAEATFDSLVDWTKRAEAGIRYYSGTAVYRKQFNLTSLPAAGEKLLLNLGEVHEEASVRLNGADLGVVWTRPPRVDITRAVRAGKNDLEITVVNLWPNRLIGDAGLPPENRFTETNIRKFVPTTPLLLSGLLGPVKLEVAGP